jgi:hypothetical protein
LRIVDHAHERLRVGRLGEQREHREADQEAIGRRAGAEPERRLERVLLGDGEHFEPIEERRA